MARKTVEELLSESLKARAALDNQIASLKARKRKEDDRVLTRKKILIGAYILEKYKDNSNDLNKLFQEMDNFLTRPHDRKLFKLATEEVV